jgi:hypothetical protein
MERGLHKEQIYKVEEQKEEGDLSPVKRMVLVSQDSKRYLEEKKLGIVHDLSSSQREQPVATKDEDPKQLEVVEEV